MQADKNQQISTVPKDGKKELVVAKSGKYFEQNTKLLEVPVDRALARVVKGLEIKTIWV